MSVEDQSQVKQDTQHNTSIRVSPLPPAVSPTNALPSAEELPGSNSPVLATMTPVSVDDFPAEYQHQEAHHDDGNGLNNKQQVIYVSAGPGTAPTILYDPQAADSLGQQISIQETISTSNGPVSVVVPSSLSNNGAVCHGNNPATVLVFQEFVDDMPTAIALK